MENLSIVIKFIILAGLISCIIGQLIPRNKIKAEAFFYKPRSWENNGKVYEKFNIAKWKDKLPDMSKFSKKIYPKKLKGRPNRENIERLIKETCIAESVHVFLILLSPYLNKAIGGFAGVFYSVLYALGNIPYIMIQRYNRPRLVHIYQKLQQNNEKNTVNSEDEIVNKI